MQIQAYSLEQDQIDIIASVAAEHKSNNSAALRYIVEDWHNSTRVQAAQMAQFRERIAKTPGLAMVEAEQEATQ